MQHTRPIGDDEPTHQDDRIWGNFAITAEELRAGEEVDEEVEKDNFEVALIPDAAAAARRDDADAEMATRRARTWRDSIAKKQR